VTGVDTNILVRLFVDDDAEQTAASLRAIKRFTEDEPGFISLIAIAEMFWVLNKVYRVPPTEVAKAVERLLQVENFYIQNATQVYLAVDAVKGGLGTFGDSLIAALSQWAGCRTTLTFDVKASRQDGFTRLQT
jgi:predicted nucleic-acid-binding protein